MKIIIVFDRYIKQQLQRFFDTNAFHRVKIGNEGVKILVLLVLQKHKKKKNIFPDFLSINSGAGIKLFTFVNYFFKALILQR